MANSWTHWCARATLVTFSKRESGLLCPQRSPARASAVTQSSLLGTVGKPKIEEECAVGKMPTCINHGPHTYRLPASQPQASEATCLTWREFPVDNALNSGLGRRTCNTDYWQQNQHLAGLPIPLWPPSFLTSHSEMLVIRIWNYSLPLKANEFTWKTSFFISTC